MKTFENYPHDPQRGHDLISTPVLFRLKNYDENLKEKKIYLEGEKNEIMEIIS